MKIDTELRRAIEAACKAQPEATWQDKEKERLAAIAKVTQARKHRQKVVKAKSLILQGSKLLDQGRTVLSTLGLNQECTRINDEELFEAAGGVLPLPNTPKWKAQQVLAEYVAATTPKQADAILLKYGIYWK